MDLTKIIKNAVRDKKVILGYNKVIKEIKTKKPELIIHAENIPKDRLETIMHNAKLANIDIKQYPNDNVSLGLICGKPFSVSVLVIEGSEK
ncbi:MAG: ribosomal L7Ae/L30e/S12e/Gadd45 family protein [Candidatus Aenigmarchaeota archaeon]|nr:ribosomal L7Ae/L30e/S12e/Gadd45 family protein [Candidatus Aenigmarchaeota archaeon]